MAHAQLYLAYLPVALMLLSVWLNRKDNQAFRAEMMAMRTQGQHSGDALHEKAVQPKQG